MPMPETNPTSTPEATVRRRHSTHIGPTVAARMKPNARPLAKSAPFIGALPDGYVARLRPHAIAPCAHRRIARKIEAPVCRAVGVGVQGDVGHRVGAAREE